MALIAMAVYDTEENKRSEYTEKTLESLLTDINNHRVIIVDNGSCQKTKDILQDAAKLNFVTIITNETNVGTAKAINQAWKLKKPGEHLIKMDNDVLINYTLWIEEMERAIERDPKIGIIGLKRKDLAENPWRNDWLKSELRMLPHEGGQPWIIVEDVNHVMGTCQMYNHRLIDKIGGLYQMDGIYGFDDSLASLRSQIAGFTNCFLPHIEIDHIDTGENPYQKEKEAYALSMMEKYNNYKKRCLVLQDLVFEKKLFLGTDSKQYITALNELHDLIYHEI
jgi:GT2 family glycosyltransferase